MDARRLAMPRLEEGAVSASSTPPRIACARLPPREGEGSISRLHSLSLPCRRTQKNARPEGTVKSTSAPRHPSTSSFYIDFEDFVFWIIFWREASASINHSMSPYSSVKISRLIHKGKYIPVIGC